MGLRAAADIASEIRALLAKQEGVHIMFAAVPSQSEMLQSLTHSSGVEWSRVTSFNMDQYLDNRLYGLFETLRQVADRPTIQTSDRTTFQKRNLWVTLSSGNSSRT